MIQDIIEEIILTNDSGAENTNGYFNKSLKSNLTHNIPIHLSIMPLSLINPYIYHCLIPHMN
jgi:hypothetical protein